MRLGQREPLGVVGQRLLWLAQVLIGQAQVVEQHPLGATIADPGRIEILDAGQEERLMAVATARIARVR